MQHFLKTFKQTSRMTQGFSSCYSFSSFIYLFIKSERYGV